MTGGPKVSIICKTLGAQTSPRCQISSAPAASDSRFAGTLSCVSAMTKIRSGADIRNSHTVVRGLTTSRFAFVSFKDFGLSNEVVRGTQAMGFTEPTPIQLRAFPIILAGKDLAGTAQTGTGKTAAFALPILTSLGKHGAFRCLVIEPTRELAAQVETAFRDYGRFTDLRVALVHGGVGYGKQREEAARGTDILVATPGRLLDLLEQRTMNLRQVKVLVLDEVDRMLDMGFLPDVRRIVEQISKDRQTLLFSATLPPEIERLAAWVLRDPEVVEIGMRRAPAETVTHAVYPVAAEQKFDLLMALLERTNFDSVLIFCRTKVNADRVAHCL